jgi:hypothetical protein
MFAYRRRLVIMLLMSPMSRLLFGFAGMTVLCTGFTTSAGAADKIQFNRDIQPILSDNCYFCHGPDANQRKGKLRLDVREAALEKEAFVPGNPADSELVYRILATDEDDLMPPPDSHKELTANKRSC